MQTPLRVVLDIDGVSEEVFTREFEKICEIFRMIAIQQNGVFQYKIVKKAINKTYKRVFTNIAMPKPLIIKILEKFAGVFDINIYRGVQTLRILGSKKYVFESRTMIMEDFYTSKSAELKDCLIQNTSDCITINN